MKFGDARKWLSSVQKDALEQDTAGNFIRPEGKYMASVIGQGDGLLGIVNQKAQKLGSTLPGINQERSRIFKAYDVANKILQPTNISKSFLGADNEGKVAIRNAVKEIDNVLETNLTDQIETGGFQKVIDNMYKNPKAFGSGPVNAQITREAITKGAAGAAAGAGTGFMVGGVPGSVIGGTLGAGAGAAQGAMTASTMASPTRAMEALIKNEAKLDAANAALKAGTSLSMPADVALRSAGQAMGDGANTFFGGAQSTQPKEFPEPQTQSSENDELDPELKAILGL
jgi:hypothetical protein